jgi:broad specificity phosphatase PhoE
MTPTPIWMRHGTCVDGARRPLAHARPASPLTLAGAAEAKLTARRLRKRRWAAVVIVSSPLSRARQTAAIVATALNAYVAEPNSAFAEWQAPHCVLGLAPGRYPPEYKTWRKQRVRNADSALPGGESLRTFAERAAQAAALGDNLAAEHGLVLIVSHRLLIGAIDALHHGYRHPADVFGHANDFHLAPAHLWTAPATEAM